MIAKKSDSSTDMESLTGIHNVSKQLIFLQESSEAVMYTLKSMMSHHHCDFVISPATSHHAAKLAHSMLEHIETQFQCINLRLKSLEKRMENILTLVRDSSPSPIQMLTSLTIYE
jgi:hypothetical protein